MFKSLKNLGIVLPALFFIACASAPVKDADKAEAPQAEDLSSAQAEEKPEWVTVTEDEFFVSQETIQYGDGFIDGYRLYEYDDNGRILKKTHIGSDEAVVSEELFYYEDGLLIRSEYISGNEVISQSVFSYDRDKQLVEESFMTPTGELQGVSSYEYDKEGHKIKWISGDSGGIPMMYTEYEYENDKISRISFFLPAGEMEGYTLLEYEANTLISEATYTASSKLEKKTEYVFQDGVMVKSLFYYGKNVSRTVEFSYDENGNVSEEKTLNRNGDTTDIILKEYVVIPVTKQVLK
ncbi:MAG: hypothetical protein B6241_00680 [Spirochaetaceae bacterium 4572_59]|nr:MAG: hypothetical protein B6241_00680 [Spirochaetaceae bacterium 4572_59]